MKKSKKKDTLKKASALKEALDTYQQGVTLKEHYKEERNFSSEMPSEYDDSLFSYLEKCEKEILPLFEKALEKDANLACIYKEKGDIYFDLENTNEALRNYDLYQEKRSEIFVAHDYDVHLKKGYIYLLNNDHQKAIKHFNIARTCDLHLKPVIQHDEEEETQERAKFYAHAFVILPEIQDYYQSILKDKKKLHQWKKERKRKELNTNSSSDPRCSMIDETIEKLNLFSDKKAVFLYMAEIDMLFYMKKAKLCKKSFSDKNMMDYIVTQDIDGTKEQILKDAVDFYVKESGYVITDIVGAIFSQRGMDKTQKEECIHGLTFFKREMNRLYCENEEIDAYREIDVFFNEKNHYIVNDNFLKASIFFLIENKKYEEFLTYRHLGEKEDLKKSIIHRISYLVSLEEDINTLLCYYTMLVALDPSFGEICIKRYDALPKTPENDFHMAEFLYMLPEKQEEALEYYDKILSEERYPEKTASILLRKIHYYVEKKDYVCVLENIVEEAKISTIDFARYGMSSANIKDIIYACHIDENDDALIVLYALLIQSEHDPKNFPKKDIFLKKIELHLTHNQYYALWNTLSYASKQGIEPMLPKDFTGNFDSFWKSLKENALHRKDVRIYNHVLAHWNTHLDTPTRNTLLLERIALYIETFCYEKAYEDIKEYTGDHAAIIPYFPKLIVCFEEKKNDKELIEVLTYIINNKLYGEISETSLLLKRAVAHTHFGDILSACKDILSTEKKTINKEEYALINPIMLKLISSLEEKKEYETLSILCSFALEHKLYEKISEAHILLQRSIAYIHKKEATLATGDLFRAEKCGVKNNAYKKLLSHMPRLFFMLKESREEESLIALYDFVIKHALYGDHLSKREIYYEKIDAAYACENYDEILLFLQKPEVVESKITHTQDKNGDVFKKIINTLFSKKEHGKLSILFNTHPSLTSLVTDEQMMMHHLAPRILDYENAAMCCDRIFNKKSKKVKYLSDVHKNILDIAEHYLSLKDNAFKKAEKYLDRAFDYMTHAKEKADSFYCAKTLEARTRLYVACGEKEKLYANFDRILDKEYAERIPYSLELHYYLHQKAGALIGKNENQEALALLECITSCMNLSITLNRLDEKYIDNSLFLLKATVHFRQDNIKKAIEEFSLAYEHRTLMNASYIHYFYECSYKTIGYFMQQELYMEALRYANWILYVNPHLMGSHFMRGEIYEKIGNIYHWEAAKSYIGGLWLEKCEYAKTDPFENIEIKRVYSLIKKLRDGEIVVGLDMDIQKKATSILHFFKKREGNFKDLAASENFLSKSVISPIDILKNFSRLLVKTEYNHIKEYAFVEKMTPLIVAIHCRNDIKIIYSFLKKGEDVNAEACNVDGVVTTALRQAILKNDAALVNMLIVMGADPFHKEKIFSTDCFAWANLMANRDVFLVLHSPKKALQIRIEDELSTHVSGQFPDDVKHYIETLLTFFTEYQGEDYIEELRKLKEAYDVQRENISVLRSEIIACMNRYNVQKGKRTRIEDNFLREEVVKKMGSDRSERGLFEKFTQKLLNIPENIIGDNYFKALQKILEETRITPVKEEAMTSYIQEVNEAVITILDDYKEHKKRSEEWEKLLASKKDIAGRKIVGSHTQKMLASFPIGNKKELFL